MSINKIAVFCGSSTGKYPIYMEQAYKLGKEIATRGKAVVYGGAHVGLMGAVASGAIDHGGKVYGVIPEFLKVKELEYKGLSENFVVKTMHERKAKMEELCDAVIALPGGFGTLDELFEIITWGQLALHRKPIGLLNTEGYYDELMVFVDSMIKKGFVKPEYRNLLILDADVNTLLSKMELYIPGMNEKWFEPVSSNGIK